MPITLRELGKATGFSVATFSRLLNGRSHLVSYETRQQILATAKELGYRPNLVGRSLRSARANTIGLIVDNVI
jgi:LacI family transcriptional regulator, galactose operon repressor